MINKYKYILVGGFFSLATALTAQAANYTVAIENVPSKYQVHYQLMCASPNSDSDSEIGTGGWVEGTDNPLTSGGYNYTDQNCPSVYLKVTLYRERRSNINYLSDEVNGTGSMTITFHTPVAIAKPGNKYVFSYISNKN